jgi:hypothetical protein
LVFEVFAVAGVVNFVRIFFICNLQKPQIVKVAEGWIFNLNLTPQNHSV